MRERELGVSDSQKTKQSKPGLTATDDSLSIFLVF